MYNSEVVFVVIISYDLVFYPNIPLYEIKNQKITALFVLKFSVKIDYVNLWLAPLNEKKV